MNRLILCLLSCPLLVPAWGSAPGEPLDCSDWVFLEPGLSCSPFRTDSDCNTAPPGDPPEWSFLCSSMNTDSPFDVEGYIYKTRSVLTGVCNGGIFALDRMELWRTNGPTETLIAYVEDRCNADNTVDDFLGGGVSHFDQVNGRFLTQVQSRCQTNMEDDCSDSYPARIGVASISGFTTTFEILQTYIPTSGGPISFRVPYMPEGFQFADWFDTYYGDLATVGDWSQAQPLQCGYPATAPSVGDSLTVTDTLPYTDSRPRLLLRHRS